MTRPRVGLLEFCDLFLMNQCMVYNKELMQLLGELDIFSVVRISLLNFIGHVNRMVSKNLNGSITMCL